MNSTNATQRLIDYLQTVDFKPDETVHFLLWDLYDRYGKRALSAFVNSEHEELARESQSVLEIYSDECKNIEMPCQTYRTRDEF